MLVYSQIEADKLAKQAEEEENDKLIASYMQEEPARNVDTEVKTLKENTMIAHKDKN